MKSHLIAPVLVTVFGLALAGHAQAQHRNATHGDAETRHCQTDYDHRAHYYHSGTHHHYCPGGAHLHGGGHNHGGKRQAANYDPIVVEIQKVLVAGGHYEHGHHQTDGIFGRETEGAIRNYQSAKGLAITGQIDAALMTSMGITAPVYGAAAQMGAPQQAPNGGAPNDILTPAEAAALLRVSEIDVIALLDKGELAGNKIGSSWRITREAIDEFMKPKQQQP